MKIADGENCYESVYIFLLALSGFYMFFYGKLSKKKFYSKNFRITIHNSHVTVPYAYSKPIILHEFPFKLQAPD